MNRLRRIFSRLQWKLTLSYTLVTSAAFVVVILVFFAVIWTFISTPGLLAGALGSALRPTAAEAAALLEGAAPNRAELADWLDGVYVDGALVLQGEPEAGFQATLDDVAYVAVVGAEGQLLAHEPEGNQPALENAVVAPVLARALQGQPSSVAVDEAGDAVFMAVPIPARDGKVLGALAVQMPSPAAPESPLREAVGGVAPIIIPTIVVASIVGAFFGYVASRGLTRRLHRLSDVAGAWSQGDFSAYVRDSSGDEIGQLGRRLNLMAEQLQNLVRTREALATVEERNRLARELHDSVKQQVFATSMQLAAARSLLTEAPQEAERRLAQAELLVQQAQQELSGLLQELRPAALSERGLGAALEDYAGDWAQQTGIEIDVRVRGAPALPLAAEQALFRVAQEALSNVARHSAASQVALQLTSGGDEVTLRVKDDGRGFEAEAPVHRLGFGLRNMRERIEALGGELVVASAAGEGVRVEAHLPLDRRRRELGAAEREDNERR